MGKQIQKHLQTAMGIPSAIALEESRRRVGAWFEQTSPLIRWDRIESPLGKLYLAATEQGLVQLAFGLAQESFLSSLDPLARIERNPEAMARFADLLRAYFEHPISYFDLPVDLSKVSPFRKEALRAARQIPAGTVWTYKRIAEAIGRPRAGRAVGQAMAHNPVPIVIPCHRVVGSNGALTGYGGGGGIPTKRWLLQLEGAL